VPVSTIPRSLGVVTLFQDDLDQAKDFYRTVFDKEPDFADSDVAVFHFDNTIIKLEKESSARDRLAPVPVAPQSAGSRVIFAIWVDDVDAACAELAGRGVSLLSGPADTAWGTRNAQFADPGGHIWGLAQDLEEKSG
jgi:lactoylglutathione lyase